MPERDAFDDLLDRARADDAAQERARERWLKQQAAESATLAGTLLDLAEAGSPMAITTADGRTHQGEIVGIAAEFVALRSARGSVLIALDAVVSVRPRAAARTAVASGDRPPPLDLTLREALADAVDDRPRVLLTSRGAAEPVAGELRAVGQDVVTLALDGDERNACIVALHSLSTVSFLASG
jgi:hypothetical protein